MNQLTIESINEKSPYLVEQIGEETFQFFTQHGVLYAIEFMPDDILMPNEDTYQFMIENKNHVASPRDYKVRDTIIAIVDEFFIKNNSTMLYICETGDNKQAARNRLFESWFSFYRQKSNFCFMSAVVDDADGVPNYTAIILRLDNPRYQDILTQYIETIHLLTSKP